MRKVIVITLGILFALVGFLVFRQEEFKSGYRNGLNTGKDMCQDILNRCDDYCRVAVQRGDYK